MASKRLMKKQMKQAAQALTGGVAPRPAAAPVKLAPSPTAVANRAPREPKVKKTQIRNMNSEQRYNADPNFRNKVDGKMESELLRTNPAIADRLTGNGPMYDSKRTIDGPIYNPGASAADRLRAHKASEGPKAVPLQQSPYNVASDSPAHRTDVDPRVTMRRAAEKRRTKYNDQIGKVFDNTDTGGGMLGAAMGTSGTLFRSAKKHFSHEGTVKRALIGTAQTSVVSGAGHAGLAALQGEDMWEAAKTGAVRGAFVGAGYQGLKGATGVNGKTIRGNMADMARTTHGTYKAHTPKGHAAAKQNPDKVSHLVREVMQNKNRDRFIKQNNNLGGL